MPALIRKRGDRGTSLTTKRFECEWNKYIDNLKRENEENISQISDSAKKYALAFADRSVENAFSLLILLLYQYETEILEKDLIKAIVLQPKYYPSRDERTKLFCWLWQNISCVYKGYDYSKLLDRVKEINQNHKELSAIGEDVPFV